MNRADVRIAKRLARGGAMPTAYDPWDDADREICGTISTKPFDYTRKGQILIFEHEQRNERITDPSRILAGEEVETSASRVREGGLSPTLTAEMGGHGNNYVYVLEDEDGLQDGRDASDKRK